MTDNAIRDDRLASLLVRTMAQQCVRNTALEDIHAGTTPVIRTGDYSDMTVVDAEGWRIPWPDVWHFGDDDMRALMREIVDKLYTFLLLSGEPGFLEHADIWMVGASRWDEPKIVEPFLPGLTGGMNYTVAPLFGTDICRFAFAPHPEPTSSLSSPPSRGQAPRSGEELYGIRIFLQDQDGSQWSIGTEMVTQDLETSYLLAQTLNGRLGLDAAACVAFAEQVMAANPTGRHPQDRPVGPG